MQQSFGIGDSVQLSAFGKENINYETYYGKKFRVTKVHTSTDTHPLFDNVGEALYEVEDCEFAFYDRELEEADEEEGDA